jgi:hypothetical protein
MARGRPRRSFDRPRRQYLREQPAERVPDQCRLSRESSDDRFEVIGDLPDRLLRHHLRMRVCFGDRFGRPANRRARDESASSNTFAQRSQLLGKSHKPCTNTTGCNPVLFARSTSTRL